MSDISVAEYLEKCTTSGTLFFASKGPMAVHSMWNTTVFRTLKLYNANKLPEMRTPF